MKQRSTLTKSWESGVCTQCREYQLTEHMTDSHCKLLPPKITRSAGGTQADRQLAKKGLCSAACSEQVPIPSCRAQDQAKERETHLIKYLKIELWGRGWGRIVTRQTLPGNNQMLTM